MSFCPVDSKLFFSRNDKQDPRFGDFAKALPALMNASDLGDTMSEFCNPKQTNSRQYILAGYGDDEGIRINGGRLGAAQAPNEIRRAFYKMTPSLISNFVDLPGIWDLGNIEVTNSVDPMPVVSLEKRHAEVSQYVHAALSAGANWIGIGGGHDYGFSDADGYCSWMLNQSGPPLRPLVINFDAHLDVRPTTNGFSSGTPFFRLLEKYPHIDFAEIGIQGHCNSRSHFEWAKAKGARILTQEEIENSNEPMVTCLTRLLDDWCLRQRPVFLSIDIDGFSSAVAPGCSQSWATGFTPKEFFPCLTLLSNRFDVRALGIYEVSPPLDHDMRTAKLAAQIIHRVVS